MLSQVVRIAHALAAQGTFRDDSIGVFEAVFDVLVPVLRCLEELLAKRAEVIIRAHKLLDLFRWNHAVEGNFTVGARQNFDDFRCWLDEVLRKLENFLRGL